MDDQARIEVLPLDELARIVEALLFLSSEPVGSAELAEACEEPVEAVDRALAELRDQYADGRRGLIMREVAGGWTLASAPIAEPAARRLLAKPRLAALTPAQLETLAIVAYLQPISRPEIARIRGVDADSPVSSLLDRGLIEESGRSQFGAAVYRTTTLFLKLFGLQSTDRLPEVNQWDPSPEERETLRDRLLRAGEARASGAPRDDAPGPPSTG
ncbi:MAG TPA: SMC-Scp complex subunit ScpB [Solirubrobacteraceae bacterium]|jgi:segregation and condensation protein B|nr:SMC-Scp complex subunit ScpB [Solirubrobacteraceae bacterium]